MVSRRIQQRVRQFVIWIIRPLAQLGVTPNTLTILGLILSALTAIVVAQGFFLAGGLLVLFAGIFDMFDGAMARVRNAASAFGAFLDSTLDRYSESIILFGLLYYALQRPDLHDVFWPFSSEQSWMITLIYIAVVGSLMVSYAKARAEGLGLECKTGLLARPERVVILAIGLLTGTTIWALALLALFSHITAIERIAYIWRVTRQPVGAPLAGGKSPGLPSQYETDAEVLTENPDSSTNNRHSPTVTGTNEAKDPSLRPVPTSVPPFTGGVHQE